MSQGIILWPGRFIPRDGRASRALYIRPITILLDIKHNITSSAHTLLGYQHGVSLRYIYAAGWDFEISLDLLLQFSFSQDTTLSHTHTAVNITIHYARDIAIPLDTLSRRREENNSQISQL